MMTNFPYHSIKTKLYLFVIELYIITNPPIESVGNTTQRTRSNICIIRIIQYEREIESVSFVASSASTFVLYDVIFGIGRSIITIIIIRIGRI